MFFQGKNGTHYPPIGDRLQNPFPDPTYKTHTDTVKFYFDKKVTIFQIFYCHIAANQCAQYVKKIIIWKRQK